MKLLEEMPRYRSMASLSPTVKKLLRKTFFLKIHFFECRVGFMLKLQELKLTFSENLDFAERQMAECGPYKHRAAYDSITRTFQISPVGWSSGFGLPTEGAADSGSTNIDVHLANPVIWNFEITISLNQCPFSFLEIFRV